MSLPDKLRRRSAAPQLTRTRAALALGAAAVADGLQFFFVVPPVPEIIDIVAMALTIGLLGFHPLLLPTFILEFIPLVDAVPLWTGCVLFVIALQKRAARAGTTPARPSSLPPPPPQTGNP